MWQWFVGDVECLRWLVLGTFLQNFPLMLNLLVSFININCFVYQCCLDLSHFRGEMNDIFHHEDTYCAISSLVHTMPWEIKAAHKDTQMFDQIMDNVEFVCSEHFKISLSIADVHTVVRVLNRISNNRYKQYQVGKLHLSYWKKDNPLKGSKGRYLFEWILQYRNSFN